MSNSENLTDEERARAASQLLAEIDGPTQTTELLSAELSKDAGELAAEIAAECDIPDSVREAAEYTEDFTENTDE